MTRAEHAAYIKSPAWAKRRARYFVKHPRKCAACGTAQHIELHHLQYSHAGRGKEPDRDLMALCSVHHELAHTYERSGKFGAWGTPGTLRSATTAMVRNVKRRGRPVRKRNRLGRFIAAVILLAAAVVLLIAGNGAVGGVSWALVLLLTVSALWFGVARRS